MRKLSLLHAVMIESDVQFILQVVDETVMYIQRLRAKLSSAPMVDRNATATPSAFSYATEPGPSNLRVLAR